MHQHMVREKASSPPQYNGEPRILLRVTVVRCPHRIPPVEEQQADVSDFGNVSSDSPK